MAPLAMKILRVALALEFAGALGAWALWSFPWMLAGAVSTSALTVLMLTWGEDDGRACVDACTQPSGRNPHSRT